MRFVTESGSTYDLRDIEEVADGFLASIRREGVSLVEFGTGFDMGDLPYQVIYFPRMPEVGESFSYSTTSHGWALSTPVAEVVG